MFQLFHGRLHGARQRVRRCDSAVSMDHHGPASYDFAADIDLGIVQEMTESEALSFAIDAAEKAQKAAEAAAEAAKKAAEKTPDWFEIAQAAPAFLFGLLLLILAAVNFRAVGRLIDKTTGVKGLGFELSFAAQKELKQATRAGDSVRLKKTVGGPEVPVTVSPDDQQRAVRRAAEAAPALKDRRILWLDDQPANNSHEVAALRALGLQVIERSTNEQALGQLATGSDEIHMIISDIGRVDNNAPDGLEFLSTYRQSGGMLPVVFYITEVDPERPLPAGASGLTNRPDELIHLIIDAMERVRPLI